MPGTEQPKLIRARQTIAAEGDRKIRGVKQDETHEEEDYKMKLKW